METALLVALNTGRKQPKELAPGQITAVIEATPTEVGATQKVIEREATKATFQCLVVPTLRVGVGTRSLVRFLRVLAELKVRLLSVQQPGLVLDESQVQLLLFLDETLAAERRSNIKAGVERARRDGRPPAGRAKARVPVELVLRLAAQGKSLRQIARHPGVRPLGASTIQRFLAAHRAIQGVAA